MTMSDLNSLLGDADLEAEATQYMQDVADDFTVGDYRFIHQDAIDEILADELSGDEYVLGCFNASFIAAVTDWPLALIEAAQKGQQYEAIGEAIIKGKYIQELAERYARADGYGHHFAHYDGHEHEIGAYYAFKVE
jgi:hypothetical protein